jgi:predicted ATPase
LVVREIQVRGYRSVRDLTLPMRQINVLVGPNGCGKTNLYRSMVLLASAADGRFARELVGEGGMPSVLWAGERTNKKPVRLSLGVRTDVMAYEISCGLPIPATTAFAFDPQIKEESVTYLGGPKKPVELLRRENRLITARDEDGKRVTYPSSVLDSESVLTHLSEPQRFPHLAILRQEFLGWRFYHQFRTDPDSAVRVPQPGVRTPVLSADGHDLAAALRTIQEIGDGPALREAVERAFPGAALEVECGGAHDPRFRLTLRTAEFRRPFDARELSDGTMRYLCLLAALLSPRPPALLALNEPETHLHPDMLEPLARLIVHAGNSSQMWLTTHSRPLADQIRQITGCEPVELEKVGGETRVVGDSWLQGRRASG